MDSSAFTRSLANDAPPAGLSLPLEALWWDAKGDWARAHGLIDHLETHDAMAVHAYLHRKQGDASNAGYWYDRSTSEYRRPTHQAEGQALLEALLAAAP